mgnify:CR=1 FL=1
MKINNLLSTIAILSIVFFSGCAKDDFVTTLGECPIVIATSPVDGAFSVPLAQTITANFNKEMNAGSYKVNFNAANFASGVYIYKLQAGSFISSKKMVLLK